jgi:hypothetical protein
MTKIQFISTDYRNKREFLAALDDVKYKEGQMYPLAVFRTMRRVLFDHARDRPGIPNYAIILTDRVSPKYLNRALKEVNASHDAGLHVYTIGVGLKPRSKSILNMLASKPHDKNSFNVDTYDELESLDHRLLPVVSDCTRSTKATTSRRKTTTTEVPTTSTQRTTTSSSTTRTTTSSSTSTATTKRLIKQTYAGEMK